ncbi:MAG: aldo/keto reductase [Chitinophagaceae bacterium]|nr:aldo/keto reductase [Chitinophagaceae bacterium]
MGRTFIPCINKAFSSIGLGCVTFGREIDKRISFSLMDYAVENGVTFFDTASAYGDGASESIIGDWRVDRGPASASVLIATKILPPYISKQIIDSVNKSLKRLRADSLDLLYLHRWDAALEDIEIVNTFNDLVKSGKVKMLGVSNFNADQLNNILLLQKEIGSSLFKSIQNNNNFAVREVNEKVVQISVENEIEIVTYSPLGAGFLTGKYKNGVKKNTRFSLIKGHQDIYFNETSFQRLNQLQKISDITGYSTSHLALVWALHQPDVATVLIGGRSRKHLTQAFSALSFFDLNIFHELGLN